MTTLLLKQYANNILFLLLLPTHRSEIISCPDDTSKDWIGRTESLLSFSFKIEYKLLIEVHTIKSKV